MKKLILMMLMAMGFISSEAVPKVSVDLKFELARPKHECLKGIWICHLTVNGDVGVTTRTISSSATLNQDGTMLLVFNSKLPEQGSLFYGDSDETIVFPKELAKQFGYASLEIVPGSYRINPPENGNYGSVLVRVNAK